MICCIAPHNVAYGAENDNSPVVPQGADQTVAMERYVFAVRRVFRANLQSSTVPRCSAINLQCSETRCRLIRTSTKIGPASAGQTFR
jgi:hypothetical protein